MAADGWDRPRLDAVGIIRGREHELGRDLVIMQSRRRRHWSDHFDDAPPSVARYLAALTSIWPRKSDQAAGIKAILRVQVIEGGRISSTRIADLLGYPDMIAVHGTYGRFGRRLANALGVKTDAPGGGYRVLSAGEYDNEEGSRRFVWELRPTLKQALRRFGPTQDLFALATQVTAGKSQLNTEGRFNPDDDDDTRERIEKVNVIRRGQTTFRAALLEAYQGQCAITGCSVQDVLEAAHIRPYRGKHSNELENGLLLRADLHTLFDLCLMTVEPRSLRVLLAPHLRDQMSDYAELHGVRLRRVARGHHGPNREALDHHYKAFRREHDV